MSDQGEDQFFEEDEPLEDIFERFVLGEKGQTTAPPGCQALPSGQFKAIWPILGHFAPDEEEALVQA